MLKTKGDGWKIFCERMNVPPFAYWDFLPGFHRLKRALDAAQEAAFVPEGFVRWLNEIRPAGAPEQTAAPVSPEEFADALETFFRQRVEWWGGPAGE